MCHSLILRVNIVMQVLNALIDIPIFLAGIFFLLAPWRFPIIANEMDGKNTLKKKRRVWVQQVSLAVWRHHTT